MESLVSFQKMSRRRLISGLLLLIIIVVTRLTAEIISFVLGQGSFAMLMIFSAIVFPGLLLTLGHARRLARSCPSSSRWFWWLSIVYNGILLLPLLILSIFNILSARSVDTFELVLLGLMMAPATGYILSIACL